MQFLEELNILIEKALEEQQIDEKITSKKKLARKKRLRAKKKAEMQKQKLQAQQKEVEPLDQKDSNGNDDNNNNNNNDREDKDKFNGSTALIEYKEEEQENYTKEFIDFVQKIFQAGKAFEEALKKALNEWKMQGDDVQCPPELYQQMVEAIDTLSNTMNTLISEELPTIEDKMNVEELQFLQIQFTAIDKYIEKQAKFIYSLQPQKALVDNGVNPEEIEKLPDTKLDDKKRNKTKLMTYKLFMEKQNPIFSIWDHIKTGFDKLQEPFNKFKNLIVQGVSGIFEASVWNLITSPVVDGFIKTLMYSNPLTAAIYDGQFGKISLKSALENLGNNLKKRMISEGGKVQVDKKGLITEESLKHLNFKKLRAEYKGNLFFVSLVNLCYNHVDVDEGDKADLLNATKELNNIFKEPKGDRDKAVKYFTNLLSTVNKICEYMKWEDKKSLEILIKEFLAKGNTEKENKDIEDKASKRTEEYIELKNTINSYWNKKNDDGSRKYSKEQIKDMMMDSDKGYKESMIDDIINKLPKQESFIDNVKELQRLLEAAEA